MNTVVLILNFWEGLKFRIFFSKFWEKLNFQVKISPWRRRQRWNLMANSSDTVNTRVKIQNSELACRNSFGDMPNLIPISRLLKQRFLVFFDHFLSFQRFPANKPEKIFLILFHLNQLYRENFGTKAVLQNLLGKFPYRQKLLFWKVAKKH